eukprot:CAMPEP_0182482584 /NCGR_PEP_ID=MMETSP1319-20130603/39548_1 /TAXON_ID=172717 /ORGANISM="Bolidomonas pacifica, Strain RCC208" /LENGTH=49 /DNA_ID= /DNA_START= /DNA_END= /DNA_ORIENTATION=
MARRNITKPAPMSTLKSEEDSRRADRAEGAGVGADVETTSEPGSMLKDG